MHWSGRAELLISEGLEMRSGIKCFLSAVADPRAAQRGCYEAGGLALLTLVAIFSLGACASNATHEELYDLSSNLRWEVGITPAELENYINGLAPLTF